ncbi:Isoprenylcysteine carboxyl methyltransferase (ICMT) family protein [Planctomycetes bacterium MalM25]|nr:Isoprenylcysteine carboxyl methyltransferase (ICMT) family protein [Planctomycetes bacterium MalM25]
MNLTDAPLHALAAAGLFVLWAVAEGAIHALGWFQPESPKRQRAGLTWLQTAFIGSVLVGWLDAVTFHLSDFGSAWIHAAGAALVLAGLAIRLVARATLGRNFSGFVQTCDAHHLETGGVYAWVRHPAYSGFVGMLVGYPLCFGSLLSLAIAAVVGFPALAYRIHREEAALTDWFGDDYRDYQRRTCRLIPFVW